MSSLPAPTGLPNQTDVPKPPEHQNMSQVTVCGAQSPAHSLPGPENQVSGLGEKLDLTKPREEGEEEPSWRTVIRTFSPSWWAVIKGTGTVPLILHAIPWESEWLDVIGVTVFCLNTVMMTIVLAATIMRYVMYPGTFKTLLAHPTQSLFLGAAPMAVSTQVQMFIFTGVPGWGPGAMWFAWGAWWLNVILAVACALVVPFMMMHVHPHADLSTMTAVWLVPFAAAVVASATGAVVADSLTYPQFQLWTIVVCYILWGIAMPMVLVILTIYFRRLATHKLPPRERIVSAFIPLGPIGSGSFAIMKLGSVAMTVFPETNTLHPMAGDILYVLGFITALILWGFNLVWFIFALASVTHYRFPLNMTWWGTFFPIGIFTISTIQLGKEMPSTFFKVLGTTLGVCLIIIWLVAFLLTTANLVLGTLESAPDGSKIETLAVETAKLMEEGKSASKF